MSPLDNKKKEKDIEMPFLRVFKGDECKFCSSLRGKKRKEKGFDYVNIASCIKVPRSIFKIIVGQHLNPARNSNHHVSVERPVKWRVSLAPAARLPFFRVRLRLWGFAAAVAAASPDCGSSLRLLTKYECAGYLSASSGSRCLSRGNKEWLRFQA